MTLPNRTPLALMIIRPLPKRGPSLLGQTDERTVIHYRDKTEKSREQMLPLYGQHTQGPSNKRGAGHSTINHSTEHGIRDGHGTTLFRLHSLPSPRREHSQHPIRSNRPQKALRLVVSEEVQQRRPRRLDYLKTKGVFASPPVRRRPPAQVSP
ncbi:unnamed protein product [Ectocarpus sp. 8 AP-2014]